MGDRSVIRLEETGESRGLVRKALLMSAQKIDFDFIRKEIGIFILVHEAEIFCLFSVVDIWYYYGCEL